MQRRPANAAGFETRTDDVFARIAGRYDFLCDLFSLGLHRLWKRRMARYIAAEPWARMVDSAAGTGDVVLRIARAQPALLQQRDVIVADVSAPMLAIAAKRIARVLGENSATRMPDIRLLDAHAMPSIATASVDLYSISLALKICDRHRVFTEALRVLRPGGCFIALEASRIRQGWLHSAYLVYMGLCMPLIGWLATRGDASAYVYLLRGIRDFPDAEGLAEEMRRIGFVDVEIERLSLGIVAIHRARKPAT